MTDYAKVGWVSVLMRLPTASWYGAVVCVFGIPVWDPTAPWPFSKAL